MQDVAPTAALAATGPRAERGCTCYRRVVWVGLLTYSRRYSQQGGLTAAQLPPERLRHCDKTHSPRGSSRLLCWLLPHATLLLGSPSHRPPPFHPIAARSLPAQPASSPCPPSVAQCWPQPPNSAAICALRLGAGQSGARCTGALLEAPPEASTVAPPVTTPPPPPPPPPPTHTPAAHVPRCPAPAHKQGEPGAGEDHSRHP